MNYRNLFGSVASRMIITLLVVTTIVVSIVAVTVYTRTQQKVVEGQKASLHQLSGVLAGALVPALQRGDRNTISNIAYGAIKSTRIFAIAIDAGEEKYYYGRSADGQPIETDSGYLAGHDAESVSQQLLLEGKSPGRVVLYMEPSVINNYIHRSLNVTLVAIVLIDILLVIVVYAALWVLVLYPLEKLKEHAQNMGNNLSAGFVPASPENLPAEFEVVREAIDRMASNLNLHISEIEKANNRLNTTARKFPIPVGICNPINREVLFLNESLIEMLGYGPEDIRSMDDYDMKVYPDADYRVESRKLWEKGAAEALEKNLPIYPFERVMRCRNGEEKIVELSGVIAAEDFVLAIFNDITDRKLAEEEVSLQQTRLRKLTAHVQDVREEERKRIAQELHDELGQILTVAKIDLANLSQVVDSDQSQVQDNLQRLVGTIDQASDTARKISENLRPGMLDLLGLGPALEVHVNRFMASTGIQVELMLEGAGEEQNDFAVGDRVATTAFRIVQESLTNVMRYAQATQVTIHVVMLQRELVIVIKDNGIGFDAEEQKHRGSFGLLGMRERAQALSGDLILDTAPGKGVRIEASLPFADEG